MPTSAFVKAKAEGRKFEKQVFKLLEESGAYVIDTDSIPYNKKKACDCYIKLLNSDGTFKRDTNGYVICQPVEIKLDKMSDRIDIYAVMTAELALYAKNCARRAFGGEYGMEVALIPKEQFIASKLTSRWKSITIN